MNKILKKFLSVFLLAATLQFALPAKNAQAGLLFTAGVGVSDGTTGGQLLLCFGLTMVAPLATGIVLAVKKIGPRWVTIPLTAGLFFLDETGPFDPNSIEAGLQHRYTFIDNQLVLKQFASAIREKFQDANPLASKYYVSLNENEIRSILSPLDLSDDQLAHVVREFK